MSTPSIAHLEAIETVRRLNQELFKVCQDLNLTENSVLTAPVKAYIETLRILIEKAQVLLP